MNTETFIVLLGLGVVACGPAVDPAVLPADPRPIEGVFDPHGFPGATGIGVEPRGQFASAVPCDLDGDGLDDLVLTSNRDEAPLHVVHGRTGVMDQRVSITDVGTSIALDGDATLQCVGDLDGDGAEELSLCGHLGDRTACRIARLAGDGSTLDDALELDLGPVAYPFYPTVQVLDLDADGTRDLFIDVPLWEQPMHYFVPNVAAELDAHVDPLDMDAVAHRVDGLAVERPEGSEGFIQQVHFADLDADGATERIASYCPGPDGNCAYTDLLIGPHDPGAEDLLAPVPPVYTWSDIDPWIHVVTDVNGDGNDDILYSTFEEETFIGFGPLDYARPLPSQSVQLFVQGELVTLGDINSDGIRDAAVTYVYGENEGLTAELFGMSETPDAFASFSLPGLVTVGPAGDFNGDGHADFVVWDARGLVLIYGHPA